MAATGIEVHGEEFGGADIDSPLVWVLDPIDGTFNYAAGSADGRDPARPAARRRTGRRADLAAVHRPALHRGGRETRCTPTASRSRRLQRADLADSRRRRRHLQLRLARPFPGPLPAAMLEQLSRKCSRMRMHGATGIDLAYAAAGILGGAISFGHHVWDHAAGVALVRAAGGIVTDLAGNDWTTDVALRAGRVARRARPRSSTSCARSATRRTT